MHKASRAIIMAAGRGERMHPLTEQIPKPLIRVGGKRMIDTVIEALHANGIHEIYVVVGYLKEQFEQLTEEFPGVTLIENPYYDTCNNIASLYVARDHLEDCMILDGDQIIFRPSVLASEFERSGYNAVWTDEDTTEWLMTVEDGIVTRGCAGTWSWNLRSAATGRSTGTMCPCSATLTSTGWESARWGQETAWRSTAWRSSRRRIRLTGERRDTGGGAARGASPERRQESRGRQ